MNNHLLPLLLWGLLLLRCGIAPLAGGSTDTELGSVVTGNVCDDRGIPAFQAQVNLIPKRYNPVTDSQLPKSLIDTTDSLGGYLFNTVPAGDYTILAEHLVSNKKLLITDITIDSVDTEAMGSDTLRYTGGIAIERTETADTVNSYVYIPGTTFFTRSSTHAVLGGIPSGRIPSVCYTDRTDTVKNHVIMTGVMVASRDTVLLADYHSWSYSRPILLNTSAAGADVPNNVTDFPVLVRLTSARFDFSQAKEHGEDLRFMKMNGTPLPYEIERWDPVTERAEVWVNVDTVRGNNSTQSITMYWGNPDAYDRSNGAAVFDTAENLTAVWHLNQNSADATAHRHNGSAGSAADTVGMIGLCKKFNGSDSIKIAGLLGSLPSITLSAWAQLDSTPPNGGSEILSIGDAALIRMDYAINKIGTGGAYHVSDSIFNHTASGKFLKQTGWHFISFSFDVSSYTSSVYIDGLKTSSRFDPNVPINYKNVGQNTYIGKHGNAKPGFDFFGRIDEVRVFRSPMTAEYIKLCFMNQREDDRLIVFKSP
jgi:hypothetical protein